MLLSRFNKEKERVKELFKAFEQKRQHGLPLHHHQRDMPFARDWLCVRLLMTNYFHRTMYFIGLCKSKYAYKGES